MCHGPWPLSQTSGGRLRFVVTAPPPRRHGNRLQARDRGEWYGKAAAYWDSIDATIDGVLGGSAPPSSQPPRLGRCPVSSTQHTMLNLCGAALPCLWSWRPALRAPLDLIRRPCVSSRPLNRRRAQKQEFTELTQNFQVGPAF
jgi:hypothetical protein